METNASPTKGEGWNIQSGGGGGCVKMGRMERKKGSKETGNLRRHHKKWEYELTLSRTLEQKIKFEL